MPRPPDSSTTLALRLADCRGDALVVARALVHRQDVEDVVQEATVRVLRTASRGTVVENPRDYLRAVVRQVAVDHLRATGRQSPVAELGDHASPHADPHRALELREVLEAIGDLPASQRAALVATALTPQDQRRLARRLQTTPAGVRQLVRRARRRLRDTVGAVAPWLGGRASELIAAATSGGGARSGALALTVAAVVAPAAPAPPEPPAPPSVTSPSVPGLVGEGPPTRKDDGSMTKSLALTALVASIGVSAPNIEVPQIGKPRAPQLELQPTTCTDDGCDPRRLAGKVVAFDDGTLTVRTDAGRTYRAVVNADTSVACPPQEALDDGRVFNPVPPAAPRFGTTEPEVPADIELRDRYACSADEISVGRRVAGAAVGRDDSGELRWIGVALAPR